MEGERRHRRPAGVHGRGERLLDAGLTTLVVALTAGWVWAIAFAPASAATTSLGDRGSLARTVTAALTEPGAPSAAFITDAALDAMTGGWRGSSGRLRARFVPAGSPVALPVDSGHVVLTRSGGAPGDTTPVPSEAGIFSVALAIGQGVRSVANFSVISLRPFSDKRNGRIGSYMIGSWPGERGAKLKERYGNPSGFIEVTPQNADTPVSEHFELRDFLTKGQANTWPKYLVLETRLIDKLELVLAELEKEGIDPKGVVVMSGFRTPSYNAGGGNTAGRANLSRHMYGDASDIYIDNDHDGSMDDLNHDGKLDIRDSRVIEAAADRVERAHPELVGGVGVYPTCCGHGPFIHIDTRGYRARWVGTSGG